MRVLGITIENDSGAALVEDGLLRAAVNEERLSRMKMVIGFPRAALREVLRLSGVGAGELDAVLVSSTHAPLFDELRPHGWFDHLERSGILGVVKRAAGQFSRLGRHVPLLEWGYYAVQAPMFRHRKRAVEAILRTEFGVRCPIRFVDHHFAHVTSAYFTSGYDDALVVSLDGGGDRKSGLVYAVRNGRFQRLAEVSAFHSLGNYYAYVTHLCGFKPMQHEGKITGLAAHGEPRYLELLREFVDEEHGTFVNRAGVAFMEAIRALDRRLPKGWTREDLAASIQRHFEETVCRFVSHWCRHTGLRDVAVAGGVFANVRVNEEVHALPEVGRLFVHPHMGDGGLGAGAALAACAPGVLDRTMPRSPEPLQDVYLGPPLDAGAVAAALSRAGLAPEPLTGPLEERVADLLVEGYVVARADGRMEYGPRALGNRSILYQPTDRRVNDWLNRNLRRTEFMPFAPAALWESRDRLFCGMAGAEHAAEFMTITFHCQPGMRETMHGVVHLDGTARPQLVRRECNPRYYAIIEAFHRRTGLPAVINTSFNMHEEPIVCTAEECVTGFLEGNLDYLAIGPHLVRHPRGLTHPLTPVTRAR